MVHKADEPIGDWTDSVEIPKTCGTAFCTYPEHGCAFEEVNIGAVDALDFVWLQGAEKCLKSQEEDDHEQLDEEPEPVDPVPEWLDAGDRLLIFVICPVMHCNFQTSYFDGVDEDEARQHYRDHWIDNHG